MRDEVVAGVLGDVVDALQRSKSLYGATPAEEHMINGLVISALQQPTPERGKHPLDATRTDLVGLEYSGRAAQRVREMFEPNWSSHPSWTLAAWLKTATEAKVTKVRAILRDGMGWDI